MKTKLISGDALVTAEYWQITGDAGEGTLMTFSPILETIQKSLHWLRSSKPQV